MPARPLSAYRLMKTRVILNPNAGSADAADRLHQAVDADPGAEVISTQEAGHGYELAAEAVTKGVDLVIAAGGDGTVNEVMNGLAGHFDAVDFGIVPLGTGNDLARTLALPEDPGEAFETARYGIRRPIDLIRVVSEGDTTYAANVCGGGFTGDLDEAMTDDLKKTWGPFAYLVGTAKALPDMTEYETFITWDDGEPERVAALNIVVANGRMAAGGRPAAPRANPEDGLLDVVVVRECSAADLTALAAQALAGDYLDSEHILYRRVHRLRVESRPGMLFNVDGELHTQEPVTFEALPGALRVAVGPDYAPTPPSPNEDRA